MIIKLLFTMTVTAPTFLSLGLIGIVKNSDKYFEAWNGIFQNCEVPISFEWWGISVSFLYMLICLIWIGIYLKHKSLKQKESKTIKVQSYSIMSQSGIDQVLSSIIPWLTIFADQLDFLVLFMCVVLQCCFITIASYNNNSYNLLCSILGYRYYEVHTEENTYMLLSKKVIRNRNEIKKIIEVTDYTGLIINS